VTVTVPFEHPVTGEELIAVCEITGRYVASTFNEPAEYPEVDIVSVREDRTTRPDVLNLLSEDDALRTSIEEAALEEAEQEPDDEPDLEADYNDPREYD